MAGTPSWKVYSAGGEYVAACKYVEDAAILVAGLGNGTELRCGHTKKGLVWREGEMWQSADESFDYVAKVAHQGLEQLHADRNTHFEMLKRIPA